MGVTQPVMDFREILKQLIQTSTGLLEIIEKERELLKQQDPRALDALSEIRMDKFTQFVRAQEMFFDRLSMRQLNDAAEFKAKFEQEMQRLPEQERAEARVLWDEAVALLKKCNENNKINGAMVQKNLQLLRRKIDILTHRGESSTYDETGNL